MAFDITEKARNLKNQVAIQPQLVVEIAGIPFKFSTGDVLRMPTLDEGLELDTGLFLDTPIKDPNSRAWISLSGSSSKVTSQLLPEKGGAGSVQSFKISILNKDNQLTELFKTGNLLKDILGTDARVWLSFAGAEFPHDYILIFDGFIVDFEIAHNVFNISISIPSDRVRQDLFNLVSSELDGTIDNNQTTITVDDTAGFIVPTLEQEEYIKSYILIGEELIKISPTTTTTEFQNVLRGQLITAANPHEDEEKITSYIRLQGNPIDLALRLLLSGPKDEYFIDGDSVDRFVKQSDIKNIDNAIFFKFDIVREYNARTGDLISVSGATESENNFTNRQIQVITQTDEGSYITVSGDALILETGTSAVIQVKSQFNVLPTKAGLGMKPKYVDLDGILDLSILLGSSLPNIDIYVDAEIKAKEWLERELFKPIGLFGLNRKGRYSIYAALPPLNTGETVFINETNITDITKLKIKRSTNKNHYNSIVYKFEKDALEDDYRAGLIIVSQNSINRIPIGNKQLTIEAAGLRDDTETRTAVTRQAQRLIDKYQYAPQYITGLQIDFRVGFSLEIGDSVIFGGEGMQLPDTETGATHFPETLMQIANKSIDTKKAVVTVDLINSAFGLNARFGVISPSSYIESSDVNSIVMKRSFTTTALQVETRKWEEFIGRKVRIRDVNFTKEQILTIDSIGLDVENKLIFEEDLSIVINEDDLIDLPDYEDSESYHKTSYVFVNPEVNVDVVTSAQIIEADPANLFVGATVMVHDAYYTNKSNDVIIESILGNVITFEEPLTYTPTVGDKMELIGFVSDEGLPYRYI